MLYIIIYNTLSTKPQFFCFTFNVNALIYSKAFGDIFSSISRMCVFKLIFLHIFLFRLFWIEVCITHTFLGMLKVKFF